MCRRPITGQVCPPDWPLLLSLIIMKGGHSGNWDVLQHLNVPPGVRDVHGDGIPPITGTLEHISNIRSTLKGFFYAGSNLTGNSAASSGSGFGIYVDSSRVLQAANKVQPRAWGALACVYLG